MDFKEARTELVSTREVLADTKDVGPNCYRIPDYQRGYAWSTQFEDLWNDIIRTYKMGHYYKHYTGMIALKRMEDSEKSIENLEDTNAFYIVDGQQRITSLIIIIKNLLEYIEAESEECEEKSKLKIKDNILSVDNGTRYRFGYSSDRKDNSQEYFENVIYKGIEDEQPKDMYLENIRRANEYLKAKLLYYNREEVEKLLNVVLDQIIFNVYFIDDEFDVRATFESMNNRGKKLSNLELLKNRLMYLTTMFEAENSYRKTLRNEIDNCWRVIYENIYYKKDDEIDDNVYLQAHWIVYDSLDKSNGNTYIKTILNKKFSIESGEVYDFIVSKDYYGAYCCIHKYIESLKEYSKYWKIINNPKEFGQKYGLEENEIKCLDRLNRIANIKYVKPAVMVVAGEKKTSISLYQKIKFYEILERNIFINRLLKHERNDYSSLITAAKNLLYANDTEKAKYYNEMIEVLTKEKNEKGEANKLYCNDIDDAIENFSKYIVKKKNGSYYDWDGKRYFLYEYNESLANRRNNNTKEIIWDKSSIEHILPQNHERKYWQKILKNIKDKNEITKVVNSLGNLLILLGGNENTILSNFSYPTKRYKTFSSNRFSYQQGSCSAQEVADDNDYWSLNDIYKRQIKLLTFMYNRWIKPKYDEDKLKTEIIIIDEDSFIEFLKKREMVINEYEKLTDEEKADLDGLDLSDEEKYISEEEKEIDNWYEGIEATFDKNKYEIKKGNNNLHSENKLFFSKKNGCIRCSTISSGKRYDFSYDEANGIMTVRQNNEIISDRNQIQDEIPKYFIETFNRYLRRKRHRDEAILFK